MKIIGSSAIRPLICGLTFGVRTNPNATDQQVQIQVGSLDATSAGTAGSNPTPKPSDPQDVAAVCTAGITYSAEPTAYAATFFMDFDMNQRSLYRYVAEPGYEFAGAAVAVNGIGVRMTAVTAAVVISVVTQWKE